jgi:hypothetical protein
MAVPEMSNISGIYSIYYDIGILVRQTIYSADKKDPIGALKMKAFIEDWRKRKLSL